MPHISGVTISTDRLANSFSQDKKNKVYVITASPNGDFQIDSDSDRTVGLQAQILHFCRGYGIRISDSNFCVL